MPEHPSAPARRRDALVRGGLLAVLLVVGVASSCVQGPPDTYVALGDSFVAGPGIPGQTGRPAGCSRSDRNYPALVRATLDLSRLVDRSCSGATTADLAAPEAVPGGVNPAQLDAVDGRTRVVTLEIGGNDIGFTSIVVSCIKPLPTSRPCRDDYVVGGDDEISRRITAVAPRVARSIQGIHRRAPGAAVVVVGYPAILPAAGAGCFGPNAPFVATDVAYLRAKTTELNAVLRSTASAGRATFVDLYGPSVGHDLCRPPLDRWVEGLAPTSAAAPMHPNARGMAGFAAVVGPVLRRTIAG